ncbi:MAG: 30S ribosomal protein S1 [Candidatus Nealsonbacteria bacterium RIFCSPHIGHO2_01_FULL_43_31]|uniref:30S ribosomal protein S1 n=1 Tax=Candidatus Nealsonbacteria bacterium RIFCSPHIGHO2_01_FULL_43_31 TaxID=1801665 RepID=A0A1G2E3I0_9BACT|nr:MAG: RNA binding S1 domain protein [Parcubacteria group bacterium GW2011_GWB1_43_6]OGZ20252.1 MAG: 30S ribosomal protein S1 [Candidatus Nealsonbacteria bacterium RIFCSPHIGHO2_01_FULL_43_31]
MKNIIENKTNDFLKLPRVGEIVEGSVIGVGRSTIYVDLGPVGTGIIYGQEFQEAKVALKSAKMGDKLMLKIIELENDEGYIELSATQAGRELNWDKLMLKKEKDESLTVKVLGANKGGLLVEAERVAGFLPVSQLSPKNYPRVEGADRTKILDKLQQLVGEDLTVKILTIDQGKDILILSEKATETEKIKTLVEKYKTGDVVEGEITGIVDFGVFVKILPDNLEGLIHISEIDWQLIDDPAEIVKVGEKVQAKIIEIADGIRISLSLKALKQDPWIDIDKKYKKSDVIEGKVTKFNPFGAFVEIAPKIQGLVHISEFGTKTKMEQKLKIGKEYQFQIIQIEPTEHRMTLRLMVN